MPTRKTRLWKYWPFWICVLLVVCSIFVCWPCRWCSVTTVLLVRHAERTSDDALSVQGQARAEELVHVAGAARLDAIYVTQFQRTHKTAAPLAAAVDIVPTQMDASNSQAVATDILTNHRGGRVLVIGHSNTVPEIIGALGGPAMGGLDEDDYDNLFVLTRCRCGVRLLDLHYGRPTPP